MKKIFTLLLLFAFVINAKAQTDFTIGSNSGSNTNSTYPCPIQDFYEGSRAQYLYLASELQAAGMTAGLINSIKFNITNLNSLTGTVEQYSISIGTSSVGTLTNNSWEPGTSQVFGPVDYTPIVGDNEFVFSAPFFWDGTSNIIVEICNGDPNNAASGVTTWTGNPSSPFTSGLGFNGSHNFRADNVGNSCGTSSTTNSGTQTTRPDIIFSWIPAIACSGTPLAGTTNSSKDSVCINQRFQLSVSGSFVGTGLTYQWQQSINNGLSWTDITATGANLSSYSVPSISQATCFRRKMICTSSNQTVFSTPVCVKVNKFFDCYCSPLIGTTLVSATGNLTPEISSIAISGNAVSYTNNHSPTNTDPKGYALFKDDTAQLMLKQGCSYTATVGITGTLGSVAMWTDWNRNNIFDSSEYTFVPFTAGNTTADVVIQVPIGLSPGLAMVRFRVVNTNALSFNQACNSFTNGEVEDYLVKIVAGTQCTGVPIGGDAISSVDSACKSASFTLSVDNSTNCFVGLTYQWQKQDNCTGPWVDISGATEPKLILTGLNNHTSFRRKITCGSNSVFSNAVCVYQKPLAECYCNPFNGSPLQSGTRPWIDNIFINGTGTNTYSYDAIGGGLTNINQGYSQYTDTLLLPNDLIQGNDYTISMTMSAGTPTQTTAFIDWNQDGVFNTTDEKILLARDGSGTISIPGNALLGWTTMRIRTRAATFNTACETNFSGETEDYLIKITPGTFCVGLPFGGAAFSSADSVCKNSAFTLRDTSLTKGVIGLTYQWYQAANCGNTWAAITGATNTSYTVASISDKTSFRLGVKCSGGTEVFSTPICVTVKSQFQCYCNPETGTILHNPADNPTIDSVKIVDSCGNGSNVNYFSANQNHNSDGYVSFLDTSVAPTFILGESYGITLNTSTSPQQAAVFVDWDQSGSFENNERYYFTIQTGSTSTTRYIKIPANAATGVTLMRIRARAATFTTACETFGSGETEDHILKIKASTNCTNSNITAATISSTSTSICRGENFTLSTAAGCSTYGISGITYQWQDSTVGSTWQNVSGNSSGATYTTSLVNQTRYFRRRTLCSNGNSSIFSNIITVNIIDANYATLPYNESFENTWIDGCLSGSRSIPASNWRNTPADGERSWRRVDDGAIANWFDPNSGAYVPLGSVGTKSARFHSSGAPKNSAGNLDVYVNCSGGSQLKRLSFDYVNPDGTDSVSILLSTDGGNSFTRIDSVGNRLFWRNKTIDFLSQSATTILRFRAVSDSGVSDIGIDNLQISTLLQVDVSATALVAPTGSISATNNGLVLVTVKNVGGSVIDFAATPMTFGGNIVHISSGSNKSMGTVFTINTGTLAINASRTDTVTKTADYSSLGQHSIRIWAKTLNDGNAVNDTTATGTFTANAPTKIAVASGFWGDASTWNNGIVPVATDTVNITGFTVTLSGGAQPAPYVCNSIGIGAGGTLIGNADELTVGPNGGGNKVFNVASGGTLNISGATIKHNGNLLFNNGANFIQSGGSLIIDGNDGTNVGSVQDGVNLLAFGLPNTNYSSGNINVTNGNLTFVDPHRFSGTNSGVLGYRATVNNNFSAAHTTTFGDGISLQTSNSGTNGFYVIALNGASALSLGSVVVNGGNTVGNRFVSPANNIGLNGNLTINANSEFRNGFRTYIGGNFTNNGVAMFSNPVFFHTYINAVSGAVTIPQTLSGNGIYRNNIPTISISNAGTGYTIGDIITLTSGTSLSPMTVYVSAINGFGGITNAVILNAGNYQANLTSASAVSGGTGSGASISVTNLLSTASFPSLSINNTNASGLTIQSFGTSLATQTGNVSSTLSLNNSIVNNVPTFVLGVSTTTKGSTGSSTPTGYFTGKFARWFANTNATTTGDMPVGKGSNSRNARVEFTTAPSKGGLLTTEYIATAPGTSGLPLTDGSLLITTTPDLGFWRIETDTLTGGNYSISLSCNGVVKQRDSSKLRVLKRPSNATNWTLEGLPGTNTGTNTNPIVVRTGLTGFSEFTIGDTNIILPSNGITLTGIKENKINSLKWIVLNEINNKLFEIQKSNDGLRFETINSINSKSNDKPTTNSYNFNDVILTNNNSYYRIKEVSKDGKIAYSNIILIKGQKVEGLFISTLYPNPAKNNINLVVTNNKIEKVTININDLSGRIIKTFNKETFIGDNMFNIDVTKLAAGNYMLSISNKDLNKSNIINFVKE